MMCPDCGCEVTFESSCPNCGHEFRKTHYSTPIREQSNDNLLKEHNELLREQNRLLKSIDKSQRTTAAYTMLQVFWH